jgi:hypothetical protein
MTLILRKTSAYDRIMGWNPIPRREDDHVILDDDVLVGRIYRELIHGEPKWRWFLQTVPAMPPNQGLAATLEETRAAFRQRYEQVKRK